jgi:predicted RNA-binding protein with PIN domain
MKQKQRLKRLERALGIDTHQVYVIIPDVLAEGNNTVVLNGSEWMSEAELSQRDHTGSKIDPFGD